MIMTWVSNLMTLFSPVGVIQRLLEDGTTVRYLEDGVTPRILE